MSALSILVGAALNVALASAALARRSLTPAGALAGIAVGLGLYVTGGPATWLILALFFVSSTLLSRVGRARKEAAEAFTGKGERRDVLQVIANGGPALLAGLGLLVTAEPAFGAAAAAALAAANADTWASEIGLLSRRNPVTLLGLRPVERGRSGGVTALGLAASLGGATLIGAAWGLACLLGASPCALGPLGSALLVAACGFAGSVVDSLLGATLQGRFRTGSGAITERARGATGERYTLVGGLRLMTNDAVNFVSGLAVAAAAAIVTSLSA